MTHPVWSVGAWVALLGCALAAAVQPPAASPHGAPSTHVEATRLVEAMRGESMQLRSHSKAPPDRVRERLRRALRPLRDDAVRALSLALGDGEAGMRLNAARMLWQLGSPFGLDGLDPIDITTARDALASALRDDDRDVRAAAATALGAMQRDAIPAVPALIHALEDEWDGTRGQACQALRGIGQPVTSVIRALEALARDPVAHVRQCAVTALAALSADSTAPPPCVHAPVTASADILPPVPRGADPNWYQGVPPTVLEPRHLRLPVVYRVDESGAVTSACIEAEVDVAIAASVRMALQSRRFAPALGTQGPVAVLVRHALDLERRDGRDLPALRLDDVPWLEQAVEGRQPGAAAHRRGPVAERDSPALRRAAFARLGEIASVESLRAIERLEHRHAPAASAALGSDPLRLALFAQFTLADRTDALSIELGHDDVPIEGYRGAIHRGVDRQAAEDAGRAGGPYISWRTEHPEGSLPRVTIRELRVLRHTPGSPRVSGRTDLVFLRRTATRWVVVGHRERSVDSGRPWATSDTGAGSPPAERPLWGAASGNPRCHTFVASTQQGE